IALQASADLPAVDVGQLHVEHDQPRGLLTGDPKRVGGGAGLEHLEARAAQYSRCPVELRFVVVDDENEIGLPVHAQPPRPATAVIIASVLSRETVCLLSTPAASWSSIERSPTVSSRAVTTTTGIADVSGSAFRRRSTSKPSRSGMPRSRQ